MSTNAKEYSWVFVASVLILALSSIPIIAGYASQTPAQHFIGTFSDRQDYPVYIATMQYGEQGNWDYQFRFTTEAQPVVYLRTFYVVLGHLMGWTGLSPALIFQLARIIFGLLACLAIYRLMSRVFATIRQKRLAFVLAILGAGFGWFQAPLHLVPNPGISPIDLWLIDAYVFFSIAVFPHFSAVIAALAFSMSVFLDHMETPRWRNIALIAICAVFVQIVNPIAFVLADCAMLGTFIFSCWSKHKFNWTVALALCLIAVIQVPILIYSLALLSHDPVWAEYNRQSVTSSPPPIYYLMGFGLLWPFAAIGAVRALRKPAASMGWAVVWVVVAIGMAFLPVDIQRRFLIAIGIPLATLATPVMITFSEWLHRRLPISEMTGALIVGAMMIMTPVLMVSAFSVDMMNQPTDFFEPTALFDAADWLNKNGTSQQVVLAAEPTAQLIAMRTPLKLYFGHAMETLFYAEKSQAVANFYQGKQPANWLDTQGITWVIFGPHEKIWREQPPDFPNLKISYQNELVIIYRVISP